MSDPKIYGNSGVCYTLVYSKEGNYLTIACLHRFVDYPEIKFYKEADRIQSFGGRYNENIEFNTEEKAIDYLNLNFEKENIDPKFYKVRKKI